MNKTISDKIAEIEYKVKHQIVSDAISKMSVFKLLEIIDNKLRSLYSSDYETRDKKLTYSKAKEFISKTRTVLT